MKKTSCILLIIVVSIGVAYEIYSFAKNYDYEKNENIYKKELLNLGYSKEDLNEIARKFNENEINVYLLKKKYDLLLEYMNNEIFNIANIDRYDLYNKSSENRYSPEDVVTYVEIGLDKEFYTNIKKIINYDDKLVLVNKYNKLPDKYEANYLVTLETKYSDNSRKMKSEAAEAMRSMIDETKKKGLKMKVISGYRTESSQNTLFNNSIKKNGIKHALTYSAKPGHSEHQTGYAADINSVEETFKNTKEYIWLTDNAYKYGFIERYPKGKEFITGYGYEPWHYRYVGVEAAALIHEKGITFEEYHVLYLKNEG